MKGSQITFISGNIIFKSFPYTNTININVYGPRAVMLLFEVLSDYLIDLHV